MKTFCERSEQNHTNPSDRGFVPSAHKYGPQASHGATTAPLFESKFKFPVPLIWFSIIHRTENADSYANGSGLWLPATSV